MLRALTACALALSTMCAANAGQTGMASHYSTRDKNQNGSRTASGRPLRDHELTGAHRSLPFGSKVRVTGSNGRSVVVTITDRGPFVRGRIIDLSMAAAHKLGFHGLARVRSHYVSRVDGGGCCGTLATRLEVGAGGESGTCRIAHGPQAAIEVASAVKA